MRAALPLVHLLLAEHQEGAGTQPGSAGWEGRGRQAPGQRGTTAVSSAEALQRRELEDQLDLDTGPVRGQATRMLSPEIHMLKP